MRAFWFSATAIVIALVGSAVLLLEKGPEAVAQTTVPVAIGDNWFCNSGFAGGSCDTPITAGDTVLWTNTGSVSHTVTECGDAFTPCPLPGGFTSATLSNGQTFSQTFSTPGTYEYYCAIHGSSTMRGQVIVAGATQTPSPSPAPTATTSLAGSPTTAPTGTAPSTATPAASQLPAAAPQTGGSPSDGGAGWAWTVTAIAGAILVASAASAVSLLRRR